MNIPYDKTEQWDMFPEQRKTEALTTYQKNIDDFRKENYELGIAIDRMTALLKEAAACIDHLLSKPVSGYWQKKWPQQFEAHLDVLVKLRKEFGAIK